MNLVSPGPIKWDPRKCLSFIDISCVFNDIKR